MTTKLHAARAILADGLYLGMMGREPDGPGLDFWAARYVEDPEAVCRAFFASEEYKARWATLQMPPGPAIVALATGMRDILRAHAGSTTGEATRFVGFALDLLDRYTFDDRGTDKIKAVLSHIGSARDAGLPPALDRDLEALWQTHRAVLANGGITDDDWR